MLGWGPLLVLTWLTPRSWTTSPLPDHFSTILLYLHSTRFSAELQRFCPPGALPVPSPPATHRSPPLPYQ